MVEEHARGLHQRHTTALFLGEHRAQQVLERLRQIAATGMVEQDPVQPELPGGRGFSRAPQDF